MKNTWLPRRKGLCLWNVEQKEKLVNSIFFFLKILPTGIYLDGRFDATSDAINLMYYVKGKEVLPIQSLYEKYYTQFTETNLGKRNACTASRNWKLKIPPTIELAIKQDEKPLSIDEDSRTINTERLQ